MPVFLVMNRSIPTQSSLPLDGLFATLAAPQTLTVLAVRESVPAERAVVTVTAIIHHLDHLRRTKNARVR